MGGVLLPVEMPQTTTSSLVAEKVRLLTFTGCVIWTGQE
jgi:hypothetical protein